MTTIATPTRVFRMNTIRLDDPDPSMDPNDVRELYAASYPHLAAATVSGPEVNDKHELVYTFEPPAVKTKGGAMRQQAAIADEDARAGTNMFVAFIPTFDKTLQERSAAGGNEYLVVFNFTSAMLGLITLHHGVDAAIGLVQELDKALQRKKRQH